MLRITALCELLPQLEIPFRVLGSLATGRAVVIGDGARVLALAAPGSDETGFWLNPALGECRKPSDLVKLAHGGIGGLRLWHAPEKAYNWRGPVNTTDFATYYVQPAMDPAGYTLHAAPPDTAVLRARTELEDFRSGQKIVFDVERRVQVAAAGPSAVALRLAHQLTWVSGPDNGSADLWSLLQLPAGAVLGAAVKPGAQPAVYYNGEAAAGWEIAQGQFRWPSNGRRTSKLGLGVNQLAGGLWATDERAGKRHEYRWKFPVAAGTDYIDTPPGEDRTDQVVQFWDGFGFCEAEYHSPGASARRPEVTDASELIYSET
jgi:hypothetical protein